MAQQIGGIMGTAVSAGVPMIARVHCAGTCENAKDKFEYYGVETCEAAAKFAGGQKACSEGCLGFGSCVNVCMFDAIHVVDGVAIVDEEKCTACGACVKACPKAIIELRNKGRRNMRVFVSCVNKDKGAVARKACKAACIGCGKCAKVCAFDAITVENNIAYIDFTKCKLCKKCVAECPTGAIHAVNFPVIKPKPAAEAPAQPVEKKEE